jgi:hypothetical protein
MSAIIPRPALQERIEQAFAIAPIVTLLGPRQCGKTTIARLIAHNTPSAFFDLEDPADEAALANPMLALADKRGLVIIDESSAGRNFFQSSACWSTSPTIQPDSFFWGAPLLRWCAVYPKPSQEERALSTCRAFRWMK